MRKTKKQPKKIDHRIQKRRKFITGQSAPKRALAWEELNEKEKLVVTLLHATADKRTTKEIQLATKLTNLETRNAYRRLICGSWLRRHGRSVYSLNPVGYKRAKTEEIARVVA